MVQTFPLNNQLEQTYIDAWGRYLPLALERARAVIESDCYELRYYTVPANSNLVSMAAGEYRQFTLMLEPGSYVLGFNQHTGSTSPSSFVFQCTDVATQHKYFDQPYPSALLFRANGSYLLPCPQPVIAPGVLMTETSCRVAGICGLVMVVAELDRDKARRKGCIR